MFGPIEFILAGVLVGFCVGVTGVGGGSLMTPILISLFRIEPHIAIGTDLLYAAISKFCGSFVHAKKMNIVWPIVIWLAVGSIPASFATHWVLDNYLSQSTHYKAVLTMVLGFMLTITGLSILFRTQIENLFNKYRKQELPDMTQDLEKLKLQAKEKRIAIMIMGVIGDVSESADDSYHWLRRGACGVTDAGCRLGAYVIRQCRFHAAHVVIGGFYSSDYCRHFTQFTDARKTDSQNFRHYLIWARPEFHA